MMRFAVLSAITVAMSALIWVQPMLSQAPRPAPHRGHRPNCCACRSRPRRTASREPFKGITANGEIEPDLFGVRSTGVSTEPVRVAAAAFLASLTDASVAPPRSRGRRRVAPMDEPELLRAPGRQLQGHERRPARRRRSRCCARASAPKG